MAWWMSGVWWMCAGGALVVIIVVVLWWLWWWWRCSGAGVVHTKALNQTDPDNDQGERPLPHEEGVWYGYCPLEVDSVAGIHC